MAWITGMVIGGLALNAYQQWRAGKAEKEAGQAQRRAADAGAELADYNAAVAELQAKDAIARGQLEEQRFRSGVAALIGSQRAGFAAGGVDVNEGSAVDVQADAALLGELDALTIRNNAAREAWGFQVEAEDYRKRAEIARKEGVYLEKAGQARQTTARIGAAATLVGGTASLLGAKYGWGRTSAAEGV